jgi:hypothetical protein
VVARQLPQLRNIGGDLPSLIARSSNFSFSPKLGVTLLGLDPLSIAGRVIVGVGMEKSPGFE